MHSSILHINTSFLPVYFGGAAFVLHSTGSIFKTNSLKAISYRLYLLTCIITTMTCGFGGASIRAAESAPGISSLALESHAWTAASVFLLTVSLAWFSWKAIQGKGDIVKTDKYLLLVSIGFLVLFLSTSYLAFGIR